MTNSAERLPLKKYPHRVFDGYPLIWVTIDSLLKNLGSFLLSPPAAETAN